MRPECQYSLRFPSFRQRGVTPIPIRAYSRPESVSFSALLIVNFERKTKKRMPQKIDLLVMRCSKNIWKPHRVHAKIRIWDSLVLPNSLLATYCGTLTNRSTLSKSKYIAKGSCVSVGPTAKYTTRVSSFRRPSACLRID